MLSGGFNTDAAAGALRVVASYPIMDSNTWIVTALNGTGSTQTVTAYVDCATPVKSPPALNLTVIPYTLSDISTGSPPGSATASCGSDIAISGGFRLTPESAYSTTFVVASHPTDAKDAGWTAAAYASSSGASLIAYALCDSSKYYLASSVQADFSVAANSTGSSSISESTCTDINTDYRITGGGFSMSDTGAYTSMFFQSDNGTQDKDVLTPWTVAAFNNDSTSHTATVYAVCV
jgi:hypothetical protein